jgi:hypothetical protein
MNLASESKNKNSRTAFRMVLGDAIPGSCTSWLSAGDSRYAGQPLDELVFETGPDGAATKLYHPALRITLENQNI